MADTPGRLLSSLSNADGRTPKVGGCVGVFFQLFDWNRRLSGKHLFSNKSLPAERPRSKKFDDDKVPMAKLLLIADENRGGFPRTSSSECQSEASSERSAEGTSKKPGVVARLMGLESLPETESEQLQNRDLSKKPPSLQQEESLRMPQYQELQMLEGLLQRDPDEIWRTPVRKQKLLDATGTSTASPSKSFLREEKMPRSRKKSQNHMEKFTLSPKKSGFSFTSVLSPSKSNKVNPPIKSQSGPSSRKLLLGAATKLLEPAAARRRPLLEHKPSGVSEKAGRDLKSSSPKDQKQVAKDNDVARRSSSQTRFTAGLLHRGNVKDSNKNGRQQITGTRSELKLEPVKCDAVEPEEETQSGECDSPASSSKENRQLPKSGGPVLRRSGSVKEEQPPTPPSRGSLFRSKSVKEEAPAQMDQDCTGKNASANKEIRLKREKKQRPVSLAQATPEPNTRKTEPVRRKPPLDQGKNSFLQDAQKNAKRNQGQERSSKGLLSYNRLFGSKKQSKKSEQPALKNEEQTRKFTKEEPVFKTKGAPKSSENSLVKSLLRRKPLSKADTVSSANKKVVEKPKYNKDLYPLYERQTRSAGSSPARNFNKDVDMKDNPEYDLLLMCERLADEDTYASDSEMFKERNQEDCERAQTKTASPEKLQGRMPTDRSLEEILKTYLYKSLKSSKDDSPLGKAMAKLEKQDDDPNVIDMEVSPADSNTVSRSDGICGDMPSRVLFDEERKATTPHSPKKLLSDSNEVTTKVNLAGPEDSEQPSPVSVLDFSAFPSTTSGEDNYEDAKHSLLSDAESGPASRSTNNSITMQGILDSYDIRFPELSETGLNEEIASSGGQEIECYVRQVLLGSGFVTDELQTPTVPSPEEIAQRLQKQQQLRKLVELTSEMQVNAKKLDSPGPCQSLMYECIEEALNSVLSPFREDNLDAVIAGCCWKQRPCGEELVAEVTLRLLAWRDMTLGMVDDVVEADMTTSSAEWSLMRQETVEVGLEVERLVFRSVMEDLVTELLGSNRSALPKLRSGFLSHHQHQQRLRPTGYRG